MKTIVAVACSAALIISMSAGAQDVPLFTTNTRLVELNVRVSDGGRRAVEGLTRNQFQIKDNGVDREIRVFEASEKSVSCALLLDTTGSMSEEIPMLRNAARSAVDLLRPGDAIAVYSFSDHLEELAAMSEDRAGARRALGRLRAGGRTALFDAISQVALRMGEHAGKKAILVLTDGGDNASVLNRQAAILRSQKAGIPIFAIASGAALHDREAANLLHELAESTGGHLFKLTRSKEMDGVFRSIVAEVEKSYLLAFQAPSDETAGLSKWHQLQVLLKNTEKPFTVRTRSGYLAQ